MYSGWGNSMTEKESKQLKMICEKMEYMKARQKAILSREKKRIKKERTRHLIKCGELAEKYFALEDINPMEFERILQALFDVPDSREYIERIKRVLPQ